ncbi:YqhA family protein [Microvirga massiliensis]|uniref:YqhA family protein n=1 Tax=Microvirga massiliensis TaxID=1033741 RepID=UPI000661096D|nr:YqhA family protein [Microvirga massiliensis]
MLRIALSLRLVMLFASFGAALGAVLMFWKGGVKLATALGEVLLAEADTASITPAVMAATDAFLFGVVLIIFAYAITFGFVFDLPETVRARMPAWMQVRTINELKHTLVEAILVYLVVDFATDMASGMDHLNLNALTMPLSVLVIAAALRLLGRSRSTEDTEASRTDQDVEAVPMRKTSRH